MPALPLPYLDGEETPPCRCCIVASGQIRMSPTRCPPPVPFHFFEMHSRLGRSGLSAPDHGSRRRPRSFPPSAVNRGRSMARAQRARLLARGGAGDGARAPPVRRRTAARARQTVHLRRERPLGLAQCRGRPTATSADVAHDPSMMRMVGGGGLLGSACHAAARADRSRGSQSSAHRPARALPPLRRLRGDCPRVG